MSGSDLAALENDIKEYKLQLETLLPGLQADPDNADLKNLQSELEELISILEGQLAELKPSTAPVSAPAPAPAPAAAPAKRPSSPPREKWSKENHPAFQAGYRRSGTGPSAPSPVLDEAADRPVALAVGDSVLAKWKSGDKAMWPAKITSITGSSSKPVYLVRFKAGGETETVYGYDIKPLGGSGATGGAAGDARSKRKADGSMASPATPTTPLPTNIISAAADIDTTALASQTRPEPSLVGDGPTRPAKIPRKVKANKELEAGKSKWQDFTAKGKGAKSGKKDSMFRTGEGVNARVGFTGSGHAMRKDQSRARHIYQQDGDEGY